MAITAGTRFGPYEIVAPLASGGMGEIYRASDPRLGREVAIKVLPEELALDPERLRRFGFEARAASALNHPNVLTVFDADVQGGVAYLVTELLHGETLRERLGRGVLPLRVAVQVAIGVADGLSAVHAARIVHRDIKPENIFLTRDDRVKILDFGLVRPVSASARAGSLMTDPGLVVGTPGYMSPEQVEGGEIDHRSDLFSLGCVLYEMATGQRPFDRMSVVETMSAALREDPPEPALPDGRPLPAAFGSIMARCLEKRPARRYQSASDLAFHLQTLESGGQRSTIATAGLPRKSRRWHLAGWFSALLAVALATVLLTLWLAGPTRSAPPKLTYLTFSGHDTAPDASPDGEYVQFHTPPDPGWSEIRVVKLTDGSEVSPPIRIDVPAIPISLSTRPRTIGRARFTPDGKGIAFVGLDDRGQAKLFLQDFVPGRDTRPSRRPLVPLADDETAESFAISPDGKRVTVSLIEQSPNLLLVERSRGAAIPPGKSEAARP